MDIRIDGARKPSGLIASATTYTLILEGRYLYLLHVGPAGNAVSTRNPLGAAAVNAVYKRIDRKVAEGLTRLEKIGKDKMAEERHSFKLSFGDIESAELKKRATNVRLKIKATQGKHNLEFPMDEYENLQRIVNTINQ